MDIRNTMDAAHRATMMRMASRLLDNLAPMSFWLRGLMQALISIFLEGFPGLARKFSQGREVSTRMAFGNPCGFGTAMRPIAGCSFMRTTRLQYVYCWADSKRGHSRLDT